MIIGAPTTFITCNVVQNKRNEVSPISFSTTPSRSICCQNYQMVVDRKKGKTIIAMLYWKFCTIRKYYKTTLIFAISLWYSNRWKMKREREIKTERERERVKNFKFHVQDVFSSCSGQAYGPLKYQKHFLFLSKVRAERPLLQTFYGPSCFKEKLLRLKIPSVFRSNLESKLSGAYVP